MAVVAIQTQPPWSSRPPSSSQITLTSLYFYFYTCSPTNHSNQQQIFELHNNHNNNDKLNKISSCSRTLLSPRHGSQISSTKSIRVSCGVPLVVRCGFCFSSLFVNKNRQNFRQISKSAHFFGKERIIQPKLAQTWWFTSEKSSTNEIPHFDFLLF